MRILLEAVSDRAKAHPVAYGHWYVDGGEESEHSPALTCVSYHSLEPVRAELLRKMRAEIQKPGMGPEALRTLLAQMSPAELGFKTPGDPVLDRFQMKVLTEGSGTQIFSTTFAQWTAREALRRAQPCTLLVRFAPPAAAKADERIAVGNARSAGTRPAGIIGRRRFWRILQLDQPAAASRSRSIVIPGVVRESWRGCGDWARNAKRNGINIGSRSSASALVDDLIVSSISMLLSSQLGMDSRRPPAAGRQFQF